MPARAAVRSGIAFSWAAMCCSVRSGAAEELRLRQFLRNESAHRGAQPLDRPVRLALRLSTRVTSPQGCAGRSRRNVGNQASSPAMACRDRRVSRLARSLPMAAGPVPVAASVLLTILARATNHQFEDGYKRSRGHGPAVCRRGQGRRRWALAAVLLATAAAGPPWCRRPCCRAGAPGQGATAPGLLSINI